PLLAFELVVDLVRALGEEEEPADDEHQAPLSATAGERVKMVDRPRAAAERVRAAQRFGEVGLGSLHRFERLLAEGEARGGGRRQRAAGAVRVPGGDAVGA